MRTCKNCKRDHPVEMFHRNKHAKDGYFRICIDCWDEVFKYRRKLNGLEFPQYTYIGDADPPRTLQESFERSERRRKALCSR